MDPSQIRKSVCETCKRETEHVDVTLKTTCVAGGNGRQLELEVKPMQMCLVCWTKRSSDGEP